MLLTRYVFMIRLEGGRGHVAPYETTHVRIPKPLKEPITLLIEDYKEYVRVGGNPDAYEYPPRPQGGSQFTTDGILAAGKNALRAKKGARETVIKMLTLLLEDDFDVSKIR
jgi:hypothetical protein